MFFFSIEINTDAIDLSIKLERDKRLTASSKALLTLDAYLAVVDKDMRLWQTLPIWDGLESDDYKLTRFPFDRPDNDNLCLCNPRVKKQLAR